jgi:hypothetical protein
MTTRSGPRPAQDELLTTLAVVEELALLAHARRQTTLSHFLENVLRALRTAPDATPPRVNDLDGPARD